MTDRRESDGGREGSHVTCLCSRACSWRLLSLVIVLSFLACSLFASAASAVSFLQAYPARAFWGSRYLVFLAGKAVFFGFASLAALWLSWRLALVLPRVIESSRFDTAAMSLRARFAMLAILGAVAAILFTHIGRYPGLAPDESYHLTIARNVVEHGRYASGHPESGLVDFDHYASVGPPVILPIAASVKLFGVSLASARVLIALSYVLLSLALFFLLKPLFGAPSAMAGIVLTFMSFGSVYLGRAVYGEVPAVLFVVLSLLLWRRALREDASLAWGFLAGVVLGLAMLSKTVMGICLVAVVCTLVLDLLIYRTVKIRHIVLPGTGFCLIVGVCYIVQSVLGERGAASGAAGSVQLHGQYLVFGFMAWRGTAEWLVDEPGILVSLVVSLVAMLGVAHVVFRDRYDPPTVSLYLMVPLLLFWCAFFTTGKQPRYLWFSCAVSLAFTGPLLFKSLRCMIVGGAGVRRRLLVGMLAVVILAPGLDRTWEQVGLVVKADETRSDVELARFVAALPEGTDVGAAYWPLERNLNFLAGRYVPYLRNLDDPGEWPDVLIVDAWTQGALLEGRQPSGTYGRYAVLEWKE